MVDVVEGFHHEGELGTRQQIGCALEAGDAVAPLGGSRHSGHRHPGEGGDRAILDDLVVLDRLRDLGHEVVVLLRVHDPGLVPAPRVGHEDAHVHAVLVEQPTQLLDLAHRVLEQAVVLDGVEPVLRIERQFLVPGHRVLEPVELASVAEVKLAFAGSGGLLRALGRSGEARARGQRRRLYEITSFHACLHW